MEYYVYVLRLESDELPFYVGKGRRDRSMAHFWPSRLKVNSHKNHVIKKAIRDGIEVLSEILFQNLTESEAHTKEVELIAFYGRRVNGGCLTNATDGGDGSSGYVATPETRERLSEVNLGRRHSAETKAKMSKSKKKMSDLTKAKMSEAKSGRRLSNETRRLLSESHKGSRNCSHIGTYVTPWGNFSSLSAAVNNAPSPISQPTLSHYCRKYNDKVFVGRATKQFLNGRTPRECGFSFVPKEEHGL